MRTLRPTMLILLVLSLFARPMLAEPAPAIEPYEAWYVLNLGGQKAGYMHVTLKQDGETIVNTSNMKLAIKRGEAELKIEQSSRFVESLDHTPLRAGSSMKLALMDTVQEVDFTGDTWTVKTTNAGHTHTQEMNPPAEPWLTPGALANYLAEAIERGDEAISVTTMDLSVGMAPVQITMKRGESKDIDVFGKVVPATKWVTTMSAAPGIEIVQWADEQGNAVRQTIGMLPGMEMEMLLADKQLAQAEFDAPEMLAASLIVPDKKIKNPRKLKRAVFDLVAEGLKENVGYTVPSAGYQKANWIDDQTLRIEIVIDPIKRLPAVEAQDLPSEAYSASNASLNYLDPIVQKLIDSAFADAPGPKHPALIQPSDQIDPAQHVTQFIRDYIDQKDLSVGFATASEVARTKQGDCTEHACLLAAVLRGRGYPTRTVTGLVYADQFAGREGIFGFHMWTQAWIGDRKDPGGEAGLGATRQPRGRWLDLDAAMPGEVSGFDATHIALSTSAMKDGESFNDLVTMLPLMQGLDIRVVELEWAD